MKQTLEEAAKEELIHSYSNKYSGNGTFEYGQEAMLNMFRKGAEWQAKQSPWISVKERLPEENEDIIIMCEHGAIFNGTYCNEVWFCMDCYIHEMYNGNPNYSLMGSIPPLWEPVAWMPIPSFDEILEANRDVLERIKEKGD